MQNDKTSTNEKTASRQKFMASQEEKLVHLFYDSQPISQREFCRLYNINRKTLYRWLLRHDNPNHAKEAAPAPNAIPVDKNPDVKIPYTEYQELMLMKAKYNAVCSICG